MTVEELLSRISSRELSEWQAYYRLEPFGEERDDFRAGTISSTIANVFADPKKRKKPFTPEEFIPEWRVADEEEETEEEQEPWRKQLAIVEMLNAAFGGKDLRAKE